MRSPFALVLGVMLGIVNYIPYFGSIFGTMLAVLIVTFTQGIQMGLIALAVLLVTQQIDANIIQPKLMGESFKLSPLLVIVSITVGGNLFGIFGMIIAIPIVKVLADAVEEILKNHEKRKSKKTEKK
jgi:predicted PurR-regulated permease PerM